MIEEGSELPPMGPDLGLLAIATNLLVIGRIPQYA